MRHDHLQTAQEDGDPIVSHSLTGTSAYDDEWCNVTSSRGGRRWGHQELIPCVCVGVLTVTLCTVSTPQQYVEHLHDINLSSIMPGMGGITGHHLGQT